MLRFLESSKSHASESKPDERGSLLKVAELVPVRYDTIYYGGKEQMITHTGKSRSLCMRRRIVIVIFVWFLKKKKLVSANPV